MIASLMRPKARRRAADNNGSIPCPIARIVLRSRRTHGEISCVLPPFWGEHSRNKLTAGATRERNKAVLNRSHNFCVPGEVCVPAYWMGPILVRGRLKQSTVRFSDDPEGALHTDRPIQLTGKRRRSRNSRGARTYPIACCSACGNGVDVFEIRSAWPSIDRQDPFESDERGGSLKELFRDCSRLLFHCFIIEAGYAPAFPSQAALAGGCTCFRCASADSQPR